MMLNAKPILLVEDDDVDVMAIQRALKELNVTNELVYAANGEEALAYLRGGDNERPCLILLDLNMPRMNGIEFLEVLRADEALKDIAVVVVTTSADKQEVARSFDLGAASYIVKCPTYGEFRESMRAIEPHLTPVQSPERLEPARR